MAKLTITSLAAMAAIAAYALFLQSHPASADHINGASYSGTNSAGGTVDFSVSADGLQVDNFHFTEPAGQCGPTAIDANVTPIFITNHQFSSMYVPSGTFSPGAASGTIAYDPDGPGPTPVCPQIAWDAATSAQVTATATATASPTATTAPTGTVAGTTAPTGTASPLLPAAAPQTGGQPGEEPDIPPLTLILGVAVVIGIVGVLAGKHGLDRRR